jgi:hypothetical protein
MKVKNGRAYYSIDQIEGLVEMLDSLGLTHESIRSSPMPNMDLLLSDLTELNEADTAWCKSALGQLHYYARGTRYDISHTVSVISQFCANPTVGTKLALKYLAGYLNGTPDFSISVMRANTPDVFNFFTDSNHYGKGRSQTGVIVLLNGAPMHWRSNRQPVTADSPAVSEIYALKEGVKDGRLIQWVAEEMGIVTAYPFTVCVDNSQAISFQADTCPNSKIRGSIDMREAWVKELRDLDIVTTKYVEASSNLADLFTKCFMGPAFGKLLKKIVDYQETSILGGHLYLSEMCRLCR